MIAPVVGVVSADVSVLTVLAIGVVNAVVVAVVAEEAAAVVNVAGAVVLSAKYANALL